MENSESIKNDLDKLARRLAGWIEETVARNALALIEQLEEENMCMKIQMHGDCGVCKHRHNSKKRKDGPSFIGPCWTCVHDESRPNWEYEGLPELPKKGESV